MSRKSFEALDRKITREYERKYGYSVKQAEAIGRATAGKIANAKHAKAKATKRRRR